jgi:hypothetical protein
MVDRAVPLFVLNHHRPQRLSLDLERDGIDAGYVEQWQHTNARRSAGRKLYSPRTTQRLRKTAPRRAGQLTLLPELNRTVARLRDFGGGRAPGGSGRDRMAAPAARPIAGPARGQDRPLPGATRECSSRARSDLREGRQPAAGGSAAYLYQLKTK